MLRKLNCLNNNAIKIVAAVFMVIDHLGEFIFPNLAILRILGRIAFPIFAFCIAEGATYTKDKTKYVCLMLVFGLVCDVTVVLYTGEIFICVLTAFCFSLGLIFEYEEIKKNYLAKNWQRVAGFSTSFGVTVGAVFALCYFCQVDYGLIGVFAPFVIYLGKNKWLRICLTAICMGLLLIPTPTFNFVPMPTQWAGFLGLLVVALYNGQRGKLNLKYFFYFFYPIHIAVIQLIANFV